MKQRKNVYQLPAGDTTLEWYGKAVLEMQKRPTTDPRSWNYQAAIHGFDAANPFWAGFAPLPSPTEQAQFWKQCQHGSWFFLPWHRMYLAYFEQIVAQTIVDLGGPADWALPYWNYSDSSNPNALTMPPAFTAPASAANGLWMKGRKSTVLNKQYVGLQPLNRIPFTGDGVTSPLGFGGPQTTFSHSGGTHGDLEGNIHDNVHVMIGGAMGNPRTAGLDPIFWLHHANIDRLWQVWLNMGQQRMDPIKSSWLDFKFDFHDKAGAPASLQCSEVEDTTKVLSGYTYEGVAPSTAMLESLDVAKKADFSTPLEVIAASNRRLNLGSKERVVHLKLTPSHSKLESFAAADEGGDEPKTTILHFENITGKGIPPIHDVYLNVPENDENKASYYAGSISFFGVEESSIPSKHHSGSGQHYALDISELMIQLRSLPNWKEDRLDIHIEPTEDMDDDANVSIGRISLYSE